MLCLCGEEQEDWEIFARITLQRDLVRIEGRRVTLKERWWLMGYLAAEIL